MEWQNAIFQRSRNTVIIACGVMRAELEAAAQDTVIQMYFLDQGLHETPKKNGRPDSGAVGFCRRFS